MPFGASRAGLMSVAADDIPDSEVYFQDDWGDNKLQDRDGSGTTTYNGVEGVYRPEWNIEAGPATVDEGELLLIADDELVAIDADININLDEPTTFEWTDVDASEGRDGTSANVGLTCYAETNNHIGRHTGEGQAGLENGYVVSILSAGSDVLFVSFDDGGFDDQLITASATPPYDIRVERDSNYNWELFIDDDSQGTATDDSYQNANYTGYTTMSDDDVVLRVDEMKVS